MPHSPPPSSPLTDDPETKYKASTQTPIVMKKELVSPPSTCDAGKTLLGSVAKKSDTLKTPTKVRTCSALPKTPDTEVKDSRDDTWWLAAKALSESPTPDAKHSKAKMESDHVTTECAPHSNTKSKLPVTPTNPAKASKHDTWYLAAKELSQSSPPDLSKAHFDTQCEETQKAVPERSSLFASPNTRDQFPKSMGAKSRQKRITPSKKSSPESDSDEEGIITGYGIEDVVAYHCARIPLPFNKESKPETQPSTPATPHTPANKSNCHTGAAETGDDDSDGDFITGHEFEDVIENHMKGRKPKFGKKTPRIKVPSTPRTPRKRKFTERDPPAEDVHSESETGTVVGIPTLGEDNPFVRPSMLKRNPKRTCKRAAPPKELVLKRRSSPVDWEAGNDGEEGGQDTSPLAGKKRKRSDESKPRPARKPRWVK